MSAQACVALLPAAGSGQRCGAPKQFSPLCGRTVLWHAVQPLAACVQVERIYVVAAAGGAAQAQAALADCKADVHVLPVGGETRARSVLNGLADLPDETWVLVHDAARPCLRQADCERLLAYMASGKGDGAALALPVGEALKTVQDGRACDTIDNRAVWAMQTPQLFRAGRLRQALAQCSEAADEAEAILDTGGKVDIVQGARENIKITYADDMQLAARLLESRRGA